MNVTIDSTIITCKMGREEAEQIYGAEMPLLARLTVKLDMLNEKATTELWGIGQYTHSEEDFYEMVEELAGFYPQFMLLFEDQSKFFISGRQKYIFPMSAYADE